MSAHHLQLPHSFLRRAAVAMVTLGSLFAVLAPAPAEASSIRSISPALAQTSARALEAVADLDNVDDTLNFDRYTLTYNRYVKLRDEAAGLAAAELGLPAAMMRDAWALSGLDKQTALLAALTQLGVPYRSHTSEPGVGFDCSGLTTFAWGVAGQALPRQSRMQINESKPRRAICRSSRRPDVLPGPCDDVSRHRRCHGACTATRERGRDHVPHRTPRRQRHLRRPNFVGASPSEIVVSGESR